MFIRFVLLPSSIIGNCKLHIFQVLLVTEVSTGHSSFTHRDDVVVCRDILAVSAPRRVVTPGNVR